MTMIREFLKGCALVLGGRRARRTVAGADAWRVVSAGQKVLRPSLHRAKPLMQRRSGSTSR